MQNLQSNHRTRLPKYKVTKASVPKMYNNVRFYVKVVYCSRREIPLCSRNQQQEKFIKTLSTCRL